MRSILTWILPIALACSQSNVKEDAISKLRINDAYYIEISMDNLVKLHKMPLKEWRAFAVDNGFHLIDSSDNYFIYSKGDLGKTSQTLVKNPKANIAAIYWYDFVEKRHLVDSFESFVQGFPGTVSSEERYFYVPFQGMDYKISILKNDLVMEEVWIGYLK